MADTPETKISSADDATVIHHSETVQTVAFAVSGKHAAVAGRNIAVAPAPRFNALPFVFGALTGLALFAATALWLVRVH